jgi:hypothetical protein
LDRKLQSSVYVALSCLLENPSNDIAVKLATCRALKATANWEAVEPEPDTILPHLEMFIKQISGLLSSVENLESQKILTETLRLVIEKARLNVGLLFFHSHHVLADDGPLFLDRSLCLRACQHIGLSLATSGRKSK